MTHEVVVYAGNNSNIGSYDNGDGDGDDDDWSVTSHWPNLQALNAEKEKL